MAKRKILVIGASACGAKVASRARRLDPDAEITILSAGRYVSVASCGLPYYVGGVVPDLYDLLRTANGQFRDPEYFRQLKDVDVRIGVAVGGIDRRGRRVFARDTSRNEDQTYHYDKLVLATGATPIRPTIPGVGLDGVHHLTRIEDAVALTARVRAHDGRPAVVIGAGFLGLEAVEALTRQGQQVTLIEREAQILPKAIDRGFAALVEDHLVTHGVEVVKDARVLKLEGEGRSVERVTTEQGSYPAETVILATGLMPNSGLAHDAGLDIGPTGAIAVDSHLCTSDSDIFAGGDAVENRHIVTGAPCYAPLGATANKHGRIIGDNLCGLSTEFHGVAGTFVCKVFDYTIAATGLSLDAAREAGRAADAVTITGFDKAHYYPGSQLVALRLTVERETGRLLGAQGVGPGEVARRIDVVATALQFGALAEDLGDLDLAYAPPYATALDVLIAAGHAAGNARRGLYSQADPGEVRGAIERREAVLFLDVRSPREFAREHIGVGDIVNVPLEDLASRVGELPKTARIVCVCALGQRAYTAQRWLATHRFENATTLAGGMFAWPFKNELV